MVMCFYYFTILDSWVRVSSSYPLFLLEKLDTLQFMILKKTYSCTAILLVILNSFICKQRPLTEIYNTRQYIKS